MKILFFFPESVHDRDCRFVDASFSPSPSSYFALMCKGPSLPFACLCETEANRMLDVYEDNSRLERRMGGKTLPGVRMMEVGEWG